MDWNAIMYRELKRANTGARLVKVPDNRRPTANSSYELEKDIQNHIADNDEMRFKSKVKNN